MTAAAAPDENTRNDLSALFDGVWRTFPLFRLAVQAVLRSPNGLTLPVNRYEGEFGRAVQAYGLQLDQMSFEITRDLATDFRVLNWRPVMANEKRAEQHVYSIGAITGPESAASPLAPDLCAGYSPVQYSLATADGNRMLFTENCVSLTEFEQSLWKQYMAATERVPRFPVLYTDLRDRVCHSLRISDDHFDQCLKVLLRSPRRVEIYPAEGVLDYSNKTAITYKQVPPQTHTGQFMTFLKLDRKAPPRG